jgi:uncharacterized membrane protein YphA (DoxX/SURF4 family)
MNVSRKKTISYWVFTLLFAVPFLGSGIGYAIRVAPVVEGMAHLGYPPYLTPFLGVAKLLGVAAILSGRYPRIKEWAYAGFTFNLVGAAYSHLCSGDGWKTLLPVVLLVLLSLSYIQWKRRPVA